MELFFLSSHKTKLEISKNTVWIQVKDEHLAMALITKKFFQTLSKRTLIIGITGTNGKSTTSQFINDIFNQLKKKTHGCWHTITRHNQWVVLAKN